MSRLGDVGYKGKSFQIWSELLRLDERGNVITADGNDNCVFKGELNYLKTLHRKK